MKKLMISTAFLAFAGTASVAQDGMFRTAADPMEVHASEFIGQRVYSSETALDGDAFDGLQDGWEDIGEVNDVILSRDGTVEAVLVDIGGFLGIGERQVAVDMSALRFVGDDATPDDEGDYFLVMNATRANLEGAPEYARPAMGSAGERGRGGGDRHRRGTMAATAVGDAAQDTADAMNREPADARRLRSHRRGNLTTEILTGASVYDANDDGRRGVG